jgi:hypothetical protein
MGHVWPSVILTSLNNLAGLLRDQGGFVSVRPLYEDKASIVMQTTRRVNTVRTLSYFNWLTLPSPNCPFPGRLRRTISGSQFAVHGMRPANVVRPKMAASVLGTPMFPNRSRVALSV